MKRKLTLVMLLSLSATSPLAQALGLGDVEVHSTLNTPLRASLPLVDTDGLQPELLNVSVASERAFGAAGLSRTPLAASIDLTVTRHQDQLVLEMRSDRPVREPWLDLLLRFDWPSGQQLHEVTLLLDPPNYDRMPALIAGSAASQATAPPESPSRAVEPTERVSAGQNAPTAVSTAGSEARGERRGPAWVGSGDTLWAVAGRLQPDSGISRNQVMVALVEANPEVFPSNNINAMRAGHTLTVPSRDTMAARSADQADRIVRAMNQAWTSRGSGAPAPVALGTQSESTPAADSAADTDGEPSERSSAPEQAGPRLTLLTDAEAAEQARARGETSVDGEAGASDDGRAEEARVTVDPNVLAELSGTNEQSSRDARLEQIEARWRESQQALEQERQERAELEAQLDALRAQLDALSDRLADSGDGRSASLPVSAENASSDIPWWKVLFQVALERSLMIGGAILGVLLALWAWIRHRRRHEQAEPSSFDRVPVVGAGSTEMFSAAPSTATPGHGETATVRSSMPEAEAINEADIFIAYGRFDQARELLEASLEQEPERDDLRLKLLTVLLETGHRQQAVRQAELLRSSNDPAVVAEADKRLQSAGVSGEVESTPQDAGPAVFEEPDAQPPRRFDARDDDTASPEEAPASTEAEKDAGMPEGSETSVATESPEDTKALRDTEATSRFEIPSKFEAPQDTETSRDTETPTQTDTRESAETAGITEEPMFRPVPEDDSPSEGSVAEPAFGSQEGGADMSRPEGVGEPTTSSDVPAEKTEPSASREEGEEEPESVDNIPFEGAVNAPLSDLAKSASHEVEEDVPSAPTRKDEQGRDVIDYQPPALDPTPAAREETPMQPSVEFTPSGGDKPMPASEEEPKSAGEENARGVAGTTDLSAEWDVEEVAFPPLDLDNDSSSTGASASASLAEARRLLEAGATARAYDLLQEVADSGDTASRKEAQALLTRYDT